MYISYHFIDTKFSIITLNSVHKFAKVVFLVQPILLPIMKTTFDNFWFLKFTFIIINFFHGILEVENLEISLRKK
jgi:hypothetical protein